MGVPGYKSVDNPKRLCYSLGVVDQRNIMSKLTLSETMLSRLAASGVYIGRQTLVMRAKAYVNSPKYNGTPPQNITEVLKAYHAYLSTID